MSAHPPILLNDMPEVAPSLVAPFTHTVTLKSGPWTCTAQGEELAARIKIATLCYHL